MSFSFSRIRANNTIVQRWRDDILENQCDALHYYNKSMQLTLCKQFVIPTPGKTFATTLPHDLSKEAFCFLCDDVRDDIATWREIEYQQRGDPRFNPFVHWKWNNHAACTKAGQATNRQIKVNSVDDIRFERMLNTLDPKALRQACETCKAIFRVLNYQDK